MNVTDTQLLIDFLNANGGLPLKLIATTNWSQFAISIIVTLFSMILVFFILGQPLIQIFKEYNIKRKFNKIYKNSGRHYLIIKHGDPRGLFDTSNVMIDRKMHIEIAKYLQKFKGKPVDIYFHTPGGEIFATQAISRLFQNYPGQLRAIVPLYAMSGGSYLVLSCDEIYMANTSCLGPIDPQLGNFFKFGSSKAWNEIVKFKGKKAEDSTISFAHMGKQYTKTIAAQLDKLLKDKVKDPKTRKKLIKLLTEGDIEHGYPITREDLRETGLDIRDMFSGMNVAGQLLINTKTTGIYGK